MGRNQGFITEEIVSQVAGRPEFSLEEKFMVFITGFVFNTLKGSEASPMHPFEFYDLCKIIHEKVFPKFEREKKISEKELRDYVLYVYNYLFKPDFRVY
ncbi:MAG: hypothetical protein DSY42_04560 [Aquifex sp.]|nr:MAG: hypothetical protein DSY42_04560 [Aquifex sp.]